MKLDLENPSKSLNYLRAVKEWQPEPDNSARNPYEAAVFKAKMIRQLLADDKDQCQALKRLMDSEVSVHPRVRNLPNIDRIYKLMCKDHERKVSNYGRLLRKFSKICAIWNEVNIMDGHMYAAITEEPWQLKHYEPGIESDSWLVVDQERGGECLAKLNAANKDYGEYLTKRFLKHPKIDKEGIQLQPNQPYRMLTYVGNAKCGNRPLFLVVRIENSSGEFNKDLAKLPNTWVPLYVNVSSIPNRQASKGA